MDAVVAKTTEHLRPEQVGVQVPNAAETTARKVRLWSQNAKPDEVLLQVDVRNAFGSVDRRKMLAEVKSHCPCLFPYAAACYRHDNVLLGDGYALESTRGVQQEDVLGPAMFAIALQPVVEASANSTSNSTCGIWTMASSLARLRPSKRRWPSHGVALN